MESGSASRRFRIGVDARCLLRVQPRGEGQSLLRLYQQILAATHRVEVLLFTDTVRPASLDLAAQLPGARVVALDLPGHRFDVWFRLTLPMLAARHRVDVLHAFSSKAPAWGLVPVISTVHDVIPAIFNPEDSPSRRRFMRGLRNAVRRSGTVLCPSEHTRTDLKNLLTGSARRGTIAVAPWGPTVEAMQDRPGPAAGDPPVLFAFGGSDRRKNTDIVLQGFLGSRAYREGARLRIVGVDRNAAIDRFRRMVIDAGAMNSVEIHGFVPNEERERLLDDSTALVYASTYEGFGLPVLDAMVMGLPVIASNASCIPEVGGDAVTYFDPLDAASLSQAIDQTVLDGNRLRTMKRQGHERAGLFDWRQCARTYLSAFEAVSGKKIG